MLLKKKLESFFFKIVFFKTIFLQGQKVLILVNAYKLVVPVVRNNRRPVAIKKAFTGRQARRPLFLKVRRSSKRRGSFKRALSAKQFAEKGVRPAQGRVQQPRPRRGLFTVNKEALILFSFHLERVLVGLVRCPVELRLKNVFSLKKARGPAKKAPLSILNLCRGVYKKVNSFWKLQRFVFLKDVINILSLSFFYQRSELVAGYLADVVRVRRKFFFELKTVKSLLPYFKGYYFLVYGASLKINILGKLFGQRKRRFRCFTLSEGVRFSTQDINVNLSYSLAHSWNQFGGFGVKV